MGVEPTKASRFKRGGCTNLPKPLRHYHGTVIYYYLFTCTINKCLLENIIHHVHTEEQLREAVAVSISFRQVLLHLGIAAKGGNYRTLRKRFADYNIDISHFTGKSWAGGKTVGPRVDIIEYLNNSKFITSLPLKKRLIAEDILKPVCVSCNLGMSLNNPIPLELDHIDGNHKNNVLSNLRLLCPNCHSLTPTFRNKKRT